MKYPYILFDLDGTITDPKVGITRSVQYALRALGIEAEDLDALTKFIGPPLKKSFMNYYSLGSEEAERAVAEYRVYFAKTGIYENRVYDGMESLLRDLRDGGGTPVLASSKPTVFAEDILTYFNLRQYFAYVVGSNLDGTRVEKTEVIRDALALCGAGRSQAVMVGDREHDILGAKQNGIASIGALYGYGGREELTRCGADALASDTAELGQLLL